MIIAVDHGNSHVKTVNCNFPTALKATKAKLPMTDDYIKYGDWYYSLTSKRLIYRRDKTTDDNFFVLTLFGIAKELEIQGGYYPGIGITLSVGLPPEHFARLEKKFGGYFLTKDEICFVYNDKTYRIRIVNVYVYPQAYAALCSEPELMDEFPRSYIIDIGGYTVDVLLMSNGMPDLSMCRSLEMGVINMSNQIIAQISNDYERRLQEDHIVYILKGMTTHIEPQVVQEVLRLAQVYTDDIMAQLRELGIDLKVDAAIFVGGGAQLLKSQLIESPYIGTVKFISDVRANAVGYQTMARLALEEEENGAVNA